MDELNKLVGANLKRLRSEKGLSLDAVSTLSGVSKSTLGQIERGETSPTISTIWRIADGLKVSFTALVSKAPVEGEVIRYSDVAPLEDDEGRVRNRPVFAFDPQRGFEVYMLEIDPQGYLVADGHTVGTEEFITLTQGRLLVRTGDVEETLEAGDAIRFRADVPHSYRNVGPDVVLLSMVIRYSA